MNAKYALIAVSLLGIVVLSLVERQHHRAELDQVRGEVASLCTSLHEGRRDMVTERPKHSPVTQPSLSPAPGVSNAAPADAPPTAATEGTLKPAPMEPIEVREQLDQRFVDERSDPQWMASAQRTAQDRLGAVLPPTSSLRSLECRASMCRFETFHESLATYQQFVQDAFLNPETKIWNGGFFTAELTAPVDGKLIIVSYLAREGEDLAPVQLLQ